MVRREYTHSHIWTVEVAQVMNAPGTGRQRTSGKDFTVGAPRSLTDGFDENPGFVAWNTDGLYFSGLQKTASRLFRVDPATARFTRVSAPDITTFTINYLGDDPIDDPAIYAKTSPMAYLKKAKTPTLIQHGDRDPRVPIANAYELRQGLEDRGVKVEMVVYKGFGHGINKPKSMRLRICRTCRS